VRIRFGRIASRQVRRGVNPSKFGASTWHEREFGVEDGESSWEPGRGNGAGGAGDTMQPQRLSTRRRRGVALSAQARLSPTAQSTIFKTANRPPPDPVAVSPPALTRSPAAPSPSLRAGLEVSRTVMTESWRAGQRLTSRSSSVAPREEEWRRTGGARGRVSD